MKIAADFDILFLMTFGDVGDSVRELPVESSADMAPLSLLSDVGRGLRRDATDTILRRARWPVKERDSIAFDQIKRAWEDECRLRIVAYLLQEYTAQFGSCR